MSDVTGVRSTDRMLFLGTDPMMFMRKYVENVEHVEDPDELNYSRVYERIFVQGVDLTDELVGHLCCINAGTIAFFSEDAEELLHTKELLETMWFPAMTWDLTSNMGRCLLTDASGPQTHKGVDSELLD